MKKVGLLAFHATHNYGSSLLAYAMQTAVEKMGFVPEWINLRKDSTKEEYHKPFRFPFNKWDIVKVILWPRVALQNQKKWKIYEKFINGVLHVSREYKSWSDIECDLDTFGMDRIICVGDQIWCFHASDSDITYMLPFEDKNIKKFSFSPSIGDTPRWLNNEEICSNVKKWLSKFDRIGVREFSSIEILSSMIDNKVEMVADPTMLLERKDWDNLVDSTPIIKEKYMLYYTPFGNKDIESKAVEFAKGKKLSVYSTNGWNRHKSMKRKNDVGPCEFLNIIKNADYVCGRSYHMLVFSLIYHKEFVCLTNGSDLRIENLLNRVGLEDRFVDMNSQLPKEFKQIDWDKVDDVMNEYREMGLEYLMEILEV